MVAKGKRKAPSDNAVPPPSKSARTAKKFTAAAAFVLPPILSLADAAPELLHLIFSHLSLVDLLFTVSPACRKFYDIVRNPKFLRWRKLYVSFKKEHPPAIAEVRTLLAKNAHIVDPETSLVRLICFASRGFEADFRNEAIALEEAFARHPLATSVCASLKLEPFLSSCGDDGGKMDKLPILSHMAAAIVFAEDVGAVQKLLRLLITAVPHRADTIIEFAYFIATLLLAVRRSFNITPRMHYQLVYALALLESNGSTFAPREFSSFDASTSHHRPFRPTFEQNRIISHELRTGEVVRIIALAGTGKTSTLIEYCRARPTKKFLVLVYNRAIRERAQYDFPSNAKCRTIHSMAYEQGRAQRFKANNKLHEPKLNEMQAVCPKNGVRGLALFQGLKVIRAALVAFMASDDLVIDARKHVVKEYRAMPSGPAIHLDDATRERVAELAREIWTHIIDEADSRIGISHDGYLKLFQLSEPRLTGFDVLMLDEAQDCTPCVLDIVRRQRCSTIFVGDPHQQIYSFRGAVNALDLVPATKTFALTQSFRFGALIAYVANCCLEGLKLERRTTLVGMDKPSYLDGPHPQQFAAKNDEHATAPRVGVRERGPLAIICRCNATVFDECIKVSQLTGVCSNRLFIMGGEEAIDFEMLLQILLLAEGRLTELKHPLIRRFRSLDALENYAHDVDNDVMNRILIVRQHGATLREHIARIRAVLVGAIEAANFVVSTTHKAKGMEFDAVRIAGDFFDCTHQVDEPRDDDEAMGLVANDGEDESNLLYVAVTRARERLVVSTAVLNVMRERCGDSFLHVLPATTIDEAARCTVCGDAIAESGGTAAPFVLASTPALSVARKRLGFARLARAASALCWGCAGADVPVAHRFVAAAESGLDARKPAFVKASPSSGDATRLALRPIVQAANWRPAEDAGLDEDEGADEDFYPSVADLAAAIDGGRRAAGRAIDISEEEDVLL